MSAHPAPAVLYDHQGSYTDGTFNGNGSGYNSYESRSPTRTEDAQLSVRSDGSALGKIMAMTNETIEKLNDSKLSWWHAKAVLIAGSGFMCDGYNLNVIGLVTDQISRLYYPQWTYWSPQRCAAYNSGILDDGIIPVTATSAGVATVCGSKWNTIANLEHPTYHQLGSMPTAIGYALSAVALCGVLAGQLIFGFLGDKFGRKRMFVLTLVGMAIFAFLSGTTLGTGTRAVIYNICFYRFFLGVFIGGDYPLSGVLISEWSNQKNRGFLVLSVFACQGVGYLLSEGLVSLWAAVWVWTGADPDYLWRLCLICGSLPAIASLYFRITMPESPRYRLYNELNAQGMLTDMEGVFEREGVQDPEDRARLAALLRSATNITGKKKRDVAAFGSFLRNYGLILLGTAGTWMMQDVAFYSKVLFGLSGLIGPQLGLLPASGATVTGPRYMLSNTAVETYINLASIYPGYIAAALLVDWAPVGRWNMQQIGFLVMTLVSAILAAMYSQLHTQVAPFFVLYAFNGFFNNFGPNATTYLLPAEVFPSEWRSTGHGISAAAGKVGAIVGTFGFHYITTDPSLGDGPAFALLAATAGAGVLLTFLIPRHTTNVSLESLNHDSIEFERLGSDFVEQKQLDNYHTPDYALPKMDQHEHDSNGPMKGGVHADYV